jgi:hypothetical protein
MDLGPTPNFAHPRLVRDGVLAPVQLHHPVVDDALGQVLVGSAYEDLLHFRILGCHCGGRRQGVIGLELHHGPDAHAQRLQRRLEDVELRAKRRIDAVSGLVTGPQVVAERLDDVISGHSNVSSAVGHHAEDRHDHATGGPYLAPVISLTRRLAVEVSEELVRAVDEMDIHGGKSASCGDELPVRSERHCLTRPPSARQDEEAGGARHRLPTPDPPDSHHEHPLVVPQLPQT